MAAALAVVAMGTNNPSDEQLDLVTDRECPPSNADGSHATPCSGRPHRARAYPTALPFRFNRYHLARVEPVPVRGTGCELVL